MYSVTTLDGLARSKGILSSVGSQIGCFGQRIRAPNPSSGVSIQQKVGSNLGCDARGVNGYL